MSIRLARPEDSPALLSIYSQYIRTPITFEYDLPTQEEFAQRISSIEDADKILVMEGGRISAVGTHQELLQNCQTYRELYVSLTKGGSDDE